MAILLEDLKLCWLQKNNFIGNSNWLLEYQIFLQHCSTFLSFQYNYFDSPTKLFSGLYLIKFVIFFYYRFFYYRSKIILSMRVKELVCKDTLQVISTWNVIFIKEAFARINKHNALATLQTMFIRDKFMRVLSSRSFFQEHTLNAYNCSIFTSCYEVSTNWFKYFYCSARDKVAL